MEDSKSETVARRGYKAPPEELANLIGIANMVPSNLDLPDLAAKYSAYLSGNADTEEDIKNGRELWKDIMALPKEASVAAYMGLHALVEVCKGAKHSAQLPAATLRRTLGVSSGIAKTMTVRPLKPGVESPLEFLDSLVAEGETKRYLEAMAHMVDAYSFIRETRNNLRKIAKLRNRFDRAHKDVALWRSPMAIPAEVSIDMHGMISVTISPLGRALEGVDSDRIRECESCDAIYWAGRLDARTCSTKCTNLLHTHLRRYPTKKEQDEYKFRRVKREEKKMKASKKNASQNGNGHGDLNESVPFVREPTAEN